MESKFVLPQRLLPGFRVLVSNFKSWLFDSVHRVDTRATAADDRGPDGDHNGGFRYLPTWPRAVRFALSNLPIADFSTYTFVDFGSGKGRVLLLAASLPSRRVLGVELDQNLHEVAIENLRKFRNLEVKAQEIRSLHLDALEFEFPNEDLVLYFFNPFGEKIMEQLVRRLDESITRNPRDIILIFVHPEYAYVMDQSENFSPYEKTESCYKYWTRNDPRRLRPT